MALKIYEYRGSTYQFDEGAAPDGAVLVGSKQAAKPRNKERQAAPKSKAAKPAATAAAPTGGFEDATDDSASE